MFTAPMSAHCHLKQNEDARIECVEQTTNGETYPVLGIGPLSIFPSDEQLREIGNAIMTYLASRASVVGVRRSKDIRR